MSVMFNSLLARHIFLKYLVAALLSCEATWLPSACAETGFTVGTLGGSWGDGIHKAFIDTPKPAGPVSYLNAPYTVLNFSDKNLRRKRRIYASATEYNIGRELDSRERFSYLIASTSDRKSVLYL